jgi:hypothetical protein
MPFQEVLSVSVRSTPCPELDLLENQRQGLYVAVHQRFSTNFTELGRILFKMIHIFNGCK